MISAPGPGAVFLTAIIVSAMFITPVNTRVIIIYYTGELNRESDGPLLEITPRNTAMSNPCSIVSFFPLLYQSSCLPVVSCSNSFNNKTNGIKT
jgi:hypothetical protein